VLVLSTARAAEQGLSPFGAANLHPRRNPLDRQSGFRPYAGTGQAVFWPASARVLSKSWGVNLIDEKVLPAVSTVHHMIARARILQSQGARQVASVSEEPPEGKQSKPSNNYPSPPCSGVPAGSNLRFEDFRVMLEKEKAIDAILCATPDHQHAYVCVTAMRHGKHVYCEKPLTHNVWEARLVARVAKETGVATQLGNQGHSGDFIRQTCEMIWDGAIGDIREVHAWTSASRWNTQILGGRPPAQAVPKGVNWDLWLGPRETRPYSSAYTPVTWRDFWDFGTAPIGDFFCHNFDPACWALDLREPLSIEASAAGGVDSYIAPPGGLYTYQFGPRGKMPAVKFMWYEGGLMPPRPEGLEEDDQLGANGNGILFIGDKGMITCGGWAGRPSLLPGSKDEAYKRPAKTLPRSKGHHRDWLAACKGGTPASANFQYGAALTEVGLLGLVALRVGKKLQWDAKAMKATNAPAADALLKESYRPGWEPA